MATTARRTLVVSLSLIAASACVPGGKDDIETDPNGIICSADLSVVGSFEASMPQPEDVFGCWPVGVWTFTATLEHNECTEPPQLEPEYSFVVMRDEDSVETYDYLTDPTYERALIKVTSGGGGLCEAGLEIYSLDGLKYLNLKPALQADGTLNGFGEYDVYKSSRW
jgi:hypothetical protein